MGYDMYLIKVDKEKLFKHSNDINYISYSEMQEATISEVNSFKPVLRDFYQSRDDLYWQYEEYNQISEATLIEIIEWLKNKIEIEDFKDMWDERTTKMVYEKIKDWTPLKENEVVYFSEDS